MASTESHQSRNWGQNSELRGKVVQAVLGLLQHFDQCLTPLDVVVEILSCKDKYSHTRQAMLTAKSIARISDALVECGVDKNALQRDVALRLVLARVDVETRKIVSRLGEASMHPILLGHAEVRKEDTDAPVLKAILERVNMSTVRAREGECDEEELEETTFETISQEPSKTGVDYTDDTSEFDFTDSLEIHAPSEESTAFIDSRQASSTWDSLFSSSYELFGSMKEHVARLIGGEDLHDREHERKSVTSVIEKGNTRAANLDCLSESQVPTPSTSRKRPREDSDDALDDAFTTTSASVRRASAATLNAHTLQSSNADFSTIAPHILSVSSVVPSTSASSSSLSPLAPTSPPSSTINRNASADINSGSFISFEPPPSACATGPAGNWTREQNESSPSSKLSCPPSLDEERKESPDVLQDNPKTPDVVESYGEANASSSTSSEIRKSPATEPAYISAVQATSTGETSNAKRNVRNVVFSAQSSSASLAAKQVESSGSENVTKASVRGNGKGKSEGTPKASPTSTPAKRGRRRKRMRISADVVRNSVSPHPRELHDLPGFASVSNASVAADEEAGPSSQASTTPRVPVPVSVQVPVTKVVYDALHASGSRSNSSRSESRSATPRANRPQDGQTTTPTSSKSRAKPEPKSAPHTPTSNTSIPDPSGPGSQVTEALGDDERTAFPVPVYPSVAASLSSNIVASIGPKDWLGSGLSSKGNPHTSLESNSKLGRNINPFAMGPSDWPAPMPFPPSALPLPNQLASYAPFQFSQTLISGIGSSSDASSSKDGTGAQASTSPIYHEGPTSVLTFIPSLEVITSNGTTSTSIPPSVVGPSDWLNLGPALPTSGADAAVFHAGIHAGSSVGADHNQNGGVDGDAKKASHAVSPEQELVASTTDYSTNAHFGSGTAVTPEVNTSSASALDIADADTTTEPVATPDQGSTPSRARVPKSMKAGRPRLPKRPTNVQTNILENEHGKEGREQGHQFIRDTTKPYTCEKCLKNYKTKKYYEDHVRSHDGATPYKCPARGCTKVFSVYSSYRKHARSPHEGLSESKVNDYQNDADDDDDDCGDDDAVSKILQVPADVNGSRAVEMPSNAEASQTDPDLR